ncbi:MAG TPA: hypothetical protein VFA74_13615 [Terriglobales bacterium]|nr:hypothetical protein [Terriglobales bacterium]
MFQSEETSELGGKMDFLGLEKRYATCTIALPEIAQQSREFPSQKTTGQLLTGLLQIYLQDYLIYGD